MLVGVVGGRNAEIGQGWVLLACEGDTERVRSVLPGHRNFRAVVVEEVCRLVLIWFLGWWEAGTQRSGGGGVIDPEKQTPSARTWYCVAIKNK